MRGSFQIAKVFGIPVQLHWSFGLIFVGVLFVGYRDNLDWSLISFWALVMLALFFCVLLHEFGHALMAQRFGVRTRDIILSPIGGVARLERLPEKPIHEFYVAIAGPLVNVGIIILLSPYFLFVPKETLQEIWSITRQYFGAKDNVFTQHMTLLDSFLFLTIALNGTLAIFNMLPAFPMDGGRVLRALLSMRLGRIPATRIAVYIGQFLAVLLVIYGLWGRFSPVIIFIGIFIFVTAASEYRMIHLERILENHHVTDLMRVHFTSFKTTETMQAPATELTRGLEKNFLVFDETQQVVGVLQEEDMVKAMKDNALEQPIAQFMHADYETIMPEDSLKIVFSKMQWHDYDICPVQDDKGQIIGVVDASQLYDFLRIQQRMQSWLKRQKAS
ncbi:MAG: site-2 protease family protein [Saprospiraceae bacterium]